jgi:hypothetical protein
MRLKWISPSLYLFIRASSIGLQNGAMCQQPLIRSVIRIQSVYARWEVDLSPDQRGINQLPPLNANFQLVSTIAYLHFPS